MPVTLSLQLTHSVICQHVMALVFLLAEAMCVAKERGLGKVKMKGKKKKKRREHDAASSFNVVSTGDDVPCCRGVARPLSAINTPVLSLFHCPLPVKLLPLKHRPTLPHDFLADVGRLSLHRYKVLCARDKEIGEEDSSFNAVSTGDDVPRCSGAAQMLSSVNTLPVVSRQLPVKLQPRQQRPKEIGTNDVSDEVIDAEAVAGEMLNTPVHPWCLANHAMSDRRPSWGNVWLIGRGGMTIEMSSQFLYWKARYLHKLIKSANGVLNLPRFTGNILSSMFCYMAYDCCRLTMATVRDISMLTECFMLPSLKSYCDAFITHQYSNNSGSWQPEVYKYIPETMLHRPQTASGAAAKPDESDPLLFDRPPPPMEASPLRRLAQCLRH